MIEFILGILTGTLLSFFFVFLVFNYKIDYNKTQIFFEKIKNKIAKNETEFFDAGDTELDAMEELYKQNKEKGVDTPI